MRPIEWGFLIFCMYNQQFSELLNLFVTEKPENTGLVNTCTTEVPMPVETPEVSCPDTTENIVTDTVTASIISEEAVNDLLILLGNMNDKWKCIEPKVLESYLRSAKTLNSKFLNLKSINNICKLFPAL